MNTIQLNKILYKVIGKKRFVGVFAADYNFDSLKAARTYPFGFVMNTENANEEGKHWQAVWAVNANTVEFYDSLGDDKPKSNAKFFLLSFKNITSNTSRIQNTYETSCGPHVIFFLIKRAQGVSFKKIINTLKNLKFADSFVKFFTFTLLQQQQQQQLQQNE